MTQSEMLKLIARHGYNVGFGAKKNFATYDLICKASGWISFISLAVGVFALFIPELVHKRHFRDINYIWCCYNVHSVL